MGYKLYDFSASPFCIKVRRILEYKDIEYEKIDTSGGKILEVKRRGKIGKVPALDIDGDLICDSTNIAHVLEERHPTPSIMPNEDRARAVCHVLEDWSDEALYFYGVYYRWIEPEGRAEAAKVFPKGFFGRVLVPTMIYRRAKKQTLGQGVARKPAQHVANDLARELDHLATLVKDRDFLLGSAPMLCDFAVIGQLIYLIRTPHGARSIEKRSGIQAYMDRMRNLRT